MTTRMCVRALCVRCACVHPSEFVRAIACTFMHGFQNNLAQLFFLRKNQHIVVELSSKTPITSVLNVDCTPNKEIDFMIL